MTKNNLNSNVAHAPSNVKDAAVGKSFIFITIVMRNAMGTLLRAASRLLSTPVSALLALPLILFLTGCDNKLSQAEIKDINGVDNGILLTCEPQTMTINVAYTSSGASNSKYQGEPCEPSTETVPGSGQNQQPKRVPEWA
jgi:hypothetical protein